jgi:DNA polymerase-3 subunit gamma/tau
MENFIVSARKYRPATFDMVVGQDSITQTLKGAIKNNHLTQAYLFCGPRGVGKTTCARIFAKTINCSNLNENAEACDKCESCLSFNTLRSFNIHELDAASNNKVDDIRSLTDQVRIPPQIGKYSIYIIDEVHMLSASAFNAFLKTLEEPPSHAIFILATTEKHKIIPTILSRCQIFDFNRIKIEDIVHRLEYVAKNESVKYEEEALHIIAQKADGALRDALSIFDQIVSFSGRTIGYKDVIDNLNVLDYEYYFSIVDAALKGDVSSVLMSFNEILDKGFDGHNFVSGLNSHLRDLLISRDEVTLRLLETTPSVKQRYLQQAQRTPVEFLYRALEIASNCDLAYKGSKNQRLHVELALIRLCRITAESLTETEKKKADTTNLNESSVEIDIPSKSEILRQPAGTAEKRNIRPVHKDEKGGPAEDKEPKSISIKDIISEDSETYEKRESDSDTDIPLNKSVDSVRDTFDQEKFNLAWKQFSEQVQSDGPRVTSMFKSILPELHPDNSIVIHLSNTTQQDMFARNYKHKLTGFLEEEFNVKDINIELIVDLTQTDGIIYSDEQKYNHLATKNPGLKDIRKTFNLDFE